MLEFIKIIPDVVWAAVLASLLTLEGVLLTNRGNNNRLLEQLRHDKDQRDREREMGLRRDVYLKAAESVSKAMSAIARTSNLDITEDELGNDLSESSASFSKIHIIGKYKTVQAVSQFSSELAAVYLLLLTKRVPLLKKKNKISIIDGLIEKSSREREKIIEMMKEQNLQGPAEKRVFDLLNNNFEFEGKRLDDWFVQRDSLNKELLSDRIDFLRECASVYANLSKLLVPVMVTIREELDMTIDETKYRQMMEGETTKQNKVLDDFLKAIKNLPDA